MGCSCLPVRTTSPKFLVYLQCYFLSIAYILGTGVLSLPVSLARSGMVPFFVVMTVVLIFQIMAVYLMTDLLQKLVALQLQNAGERSSLSNGAVLDSSGEGDKLLDSNEIMELSNEIDGVDEPATQTDSGSLPGHVDLFALGDRFLPRILSYAFGIHVLLTFTINGLSYALAGSQAYSDVFSITNTIVVLPFFCWILNLLAVFGRRLVDPFVSILTLFKGTLLLIVVVIAFIVGSTIQKEITNDFHYIADSFLTATVALGGTFLTMPYMFTKISFSEPDVRYYRLAITLGMVTCYVLETLWCWAVLDVVPQVDPCLSIDYTNTSTTGCLPPGYTLQSAEENGEISTVPFSRVLDDSYPMYSWVGTVISVFIMISITVSYTFNSTVLCQTVEGVVSSVWRISWNRCDFKLASSEAIVAIAANFFLMTVIFVVALFNPQSFVIIVSKAMSIANNFGVGFYISIMMWRCTGKNFQYLEIPLPLSKFQVKLQYLVSVFFMLATVGGVVSWILESI